MRFHIQSVRCLFYLLEGVTLFGLVLEILVDQLVVYFASFEFHFFHDLFLSFDLLLILSWWRSKYFDCGLCCRVGSSSFDLRVFRGAWSQIFIRGLVGRFFGRGEFLDQFILLSSGGLPFGWRGSLLVLRLVGGNWFDVFLQRLLHVEIDWFWALILFSRGETANSWVVSELFVELLISLGDDWRAVDVVYRLVLGLCDSEIHFFVGHILLHLGWNTSLSGHSHNFFLLPCSFKSLHLFVQTLDTVEISLLSFILAIWMIDQWCVGMLMDVFFKLIIISSFILLFQMLSFLDSRIQIQAFISCSVCFELNWIVKSLRFERALFQFLLLFFVLHFLLPNFFLACWVQ